jgi:hypothetical protein
MAGQILYEILFVCKKINKNIATVLNFEVVPNRFNVHKIQRDSTLLSGFPFSSRRKQNETADGIRKYNSKRFIWQRSTHRIHVWEKI